VLFDLCWHKHVALGGARDQRTLLADENALVSFLCGSLD